MKRILKYIIALAAPVTFSGVVQAQAVDSVCFGENVCVTTTAFQGNIQWQYSSDSIMWADVPGGTNDTICFPITASYYVRAAILENTCDTFFTDGHYIFLRNYDRSATFNFTGAMETWTVPLDACDSIKIEVWGAAGGSGATGGIGASGGAGGLGGYIIATFPAIPGQVLNIFVGGQGATPTGGFNGGAAGGNQNAGGGGGASDVRFGGTAEANRIITAGGGGGGGRAGCESSATINGGTGGSGGGGNGGNGVDAPTSGGVAGGGGGGVGAAGGGAGIGCGGFLGAPGAPASGGTGGAGGGGQACCCFGSPSIPGGGGGGGGLIAGGGGGGGSAGTTGCSGNDKGAGGGGAGGSTGTVGFNSVITPGVNVGNGMIIIHY